MKNFFVTLLLLALLGGFSTFVVLNSRYKNVILVQSFYADIFLHNANL